ncbi:PAS domain S-box protein [Chlorogloeopsis sp. ULAP01]|uniref:PAS domain S-box protein n=1 Tax=Chlorogloeopsis sp. ULAP01 TaxID=3056483 RepID=UPI0025AB0CC7|nr:PAS domain S-box protein [Chlorogloeopsis sp. ULAP01]MDM9384969.1 PAS domain S-box protein [Chlorogloeopsis sp. ULAP01]
MALTTDLGCHELGGSQLVAAGTEEQLRLLESVVVHANDAIVITTADRLDAPFGPQIVYINEAFTRMSGYCATEAIGKTPRLLQGELTDRTQLNRIRVALQNRLPVTAELINYHKNGSAYWVEINIAPITDCEGKVTHFVSVQRDITERKHTEEELQNTNRKFRGIFNGTFQFMVLLTPEGIVLEANQTALDFGGLQPQEVIGRPFWETHWWAISTPIQNQLKAAIALAVKNEFVRYEVDLLGAGDTVASFDFCVRSLKDDSGKVVMLLAEGQNITQLKQAQVELERLEISRQQIQETLQKQDCAEIALQESERRYQTIAAVLPVGIFRTDVMGNCLYVNHRWCEITGLTPEEATGHGWERMLHPDDRERIIQDWYQAAAHNLPFSSEYRFQRPDGSISWVVGQSVAERTDTGEIIAYIGTITEISDRKHTEEALKQSEERFRNLIETSSDLIWEVDENAAYTYVSPKVSDILGYQPEEILGKIPLQLMPQYKRDSIAQLFFEIVSQQKAFECLENINLHKNGHPVVLETNGVPIFDREGKFRGYRGISRDVTERNQAQAALQATQQQLQAILDNSPAVIYLTDTQNRFLLINRQYEQLFHITKAEIVGKSVYDVFPHEFASKFAANNHNVFTTGEHLEVEEVAPQTDGEHIYLSVKFPLKDGNGVPYAICGISTDITDRKRVEESLVRFRKAIESSSDAIGLIDNGGEQIDVNPAFVELFEYTLAELQAAGGMLALYPHQAEYQKIFAAVESGHSWRGEVKMKTRRGEILDIYLRADAIKDVTGKIIGTVSIHTDITERKQAEASLRLRDRVIAASTNGIVIADVRLPQLPIIYVNSAFENITGYSIEEIIGQSSCLIQSADLNQIEAQEINTAIKQAKNCTVILRNYRQDGSLFWNELSIFPVFDADGIYTHYVGIQNDITNRKQAEAALLLSQARLQYLLSSTPAIIYSCKPDGDYGVTFISDNITAVMGYEAREFVEDSSFWINHIHPDDLARVLTEVSKIFDQGENSYEYRFLHSDGEYRWVYDQAKLVLWDDAGNPVEIVGYRADITKYKQLEQELRTALEKEKELNELKSRFITMTSHEFRTPLSTILSSSELLEHYRHKWTEEKLLLHIHRIQTAVKHMTDMLNDVLVIGKVEVGKLEFRPVPLDLVEYCCNLLEELQIDIDPQCAIAFNCEYKFIPGCMDEKLLGYILRNLLSNARKYSPNHRIVKFTLTCQQEQAVFEIKDQGIGIPSEDLPHLFESFHRAANVGNIQGTGLGLAIVKKCVDIHRGEITVNSELEAGTTFTVALPLNNI